MGKFEDFMKNPYWAEEYNKASDKMKEYYRFTWENNYPDSMTENEKEKLKSVMDSFDKEDWLYLIDHAGIGIAKYHYTKLMNEHFPYVWTAIDYKLKEYDPNYQPIEEYYPTRNWQLVNEVAYFIDDNGLVTGIDANAGRFCSVEGMTIGGQTFHDSPEFKIAYAKFKSLRKFFDLAPNKRLPFKACILAAYIVLNADDYKKVAEDITLLAESENADNFVNTLMERY